MRMDLAAWNWPSAFVLNLAVKQPDAELFLLCPFNPSLSVIHIVLNQSYCIAKRGSCERNFS